MSSTPSSTERNNSSNDDWENYFDMSPRYGLEEELDTDDSFWKFKNEPKYPQKRGKAVLIVFAIRMINISLPAATSGECYKSFDRPDNTSFSSK